MTSDSTQHVQSRCRKTQPDVVAERSIALFSQKFEGIEPQGVSLTCGRCVIIGEHVDYCNGVVLPFANDKKLAVALSFDQSGNFQAVSELCRDEDATCTMEQFKDNTYRIKSWADYVKVCAFTTLGKVNKVQDISGIKVAVSSDIPIGAGVASSAALTVATAIAVLCALGIPNALDLEEIALGCAQKAEHALGIKCGSMDQTAICHGKQHNAVKYDCQSHGLELVALDATIKFVIVNSGYAHRLVEGEYNSRRAACERAVRCIAEKYSTVQSLRDVSPSRLQEFKSVMDPEAFMRATHVVNEMRRVEEFCELARQRNFPAAGQALYETHYSLKTFYENSTVLIDKIVELATEFEGVLGARIMGGGFGGSVIVMTKAGSAQEVSEQLLKAFLPFYYTTVSQMDGDKSDKIKLTIPTSFVAEPADGARAYVVNTA